MLEIIHQIVWGPWLMVFFLGTGALFTVKSRFFPAAGFRIWWKATAGSVKQAPKAQVKTACTALAATVGTGNIVGVATALAAGGPGALFWMWVSALMGMMTAYSEVYLGVKTRFLLDEGEMICGPFVYLEKLAGKKGMALLYALLCLFASLGMGSMVQANSLAETAGYSFHLSPPAAGIVLCGLAAAVICGGRKRIGEAAGALVPFSAGIYMGFSLLVLFFCRQNLLWALKEIFREAFNVRAAAGGAAGAGISRAMRYGLARGVFSNEGGLGSMAVLHGDSPGQDPKLQGMWAMFEVFFDTIVVCTLTGLVILCCIRGGEGKELQGAALASWCFQSCLGKPGGYVVSLSMMLFAFGTIIAWHYLGSQALAYLTCRMDADYRKGALRIYRVIYLTALWLGSMAAMEKVWMFSDIVNGLMAVPNLAALILLSREIQFPEEWEQRRRKRKRRFSDRAKGYLGSSGGVWENGVFWIILVLGVLFTAAI